MSTATTLARLKSALDLFYKDVPELVLSCTLPLKILPQLKLDPKNAKEVYSLDDNILRWDQTHPLNALFGDFTGKSPRNLNLPPQTRAAGTVFRKGPQGLYRWREFYQYDLDFDYNLYGLKPLERFARFFEGLGSGFYIKIKDLKKESSEIPWNIEGVPLLWDKSLKRDHAYYSGLVFEVWHKDCNVALGGGGVYNSDQTIGYSFGLTRIAKLLAQGKISFKLEPVVALYVKEGIPNIPEEVTKDLNFKIIPFKASKNITYDYQKMVDCFKLWGYEIKYTLIHGEFESLTGNYKFKPPKGTTKIYTLTELIENLKVWMS